MTGFDEAILHWLNQFAQRSPAFDSTVVFISESALFKGEALMAALWWLWFSTRKDREHNRQVILATLGAIFVSILLGRLLAGGSITGLLPFRSRPLSSPDFRVPFGFHHQEPFRYWSAFPSDHAMLFSAAATGLFFISRRLGLFAHAYWILVIGFPRLYLGLHYPTDILGGAAIGIATAVFLNWASVRGAIAALPMRWLERHPASFYAAFFVLSVQITELFVDARALILVVLRAVHPSALAPHP